MEGLLLAAAAVIVTFNSENVIGDCLESLGKMAPTMMPLIVDNASQDRTLEMVTTRSRSAAGTRPAPVVVANRENRGFAAAVNQGFRVAEERISAEFILLLNPDVRLQTPVDDLIDAAREHGLAAGKLVSDNGRVQTGFTIRRFPTPTTFAFEMFGINRLWPSNPINRRYRYLDRNLDEAGPVDQPAGAFLMVRRDAWDQLAGFDESFYPVWFEDVDFCARAAAAGFQTQYVPSAVAMHVGGHSVLQLPVGCRVIYWCASLLRYAKKHFGLRGYRGTATVVLLSSAPRMLAGVVQERSFKPVATYLRVIRLAMLCLTSRGNAAPGVSEN